MSLRCELNVTSYDRVCHHQLTFSRPVIAVDWGQLEIFCIIISEWSRVEQWSVTYKYQITPHQQYYQWYHPINTIIDINTISSYKQHMQQCINFHSYLYLGQCTCLWSKYLKKLFFITLKACSQCNNILIISAGVHSAALRRSDKCWKPLSQLPLASHI